MGPHVVGAERWFGWSVALALLVQLGLFAWTTAPGLAGTADSGFYVHAAGTLRASGHLLHPDGTAYRYWPPLYPVLVALSGSLSALRIIHGLALGLSLLAWSQLGRQLLPRAAALVVPWALALSTPGLVVSKFVWGETVFLALVAGYALALFRGLQTWRGQWWVAATALGFLLPLQRTAGLFLLAGLALGLLFQYQHLALRQRLLVLGHFVLTALGGLAWHFYALLLAAPSVYRVNRGWAQFFSSAADYGFVLSRWLLPVRAAWQPESTAVWGLAFVGLLAWLWPRWAGGEQRPTASPDVSPWVRHYPAVLWVGAVFFLLLLLVATTFTRSAAGLYDAERYASVLFGTVVLLALLGVGRGFKSPLGSRKWFSVLAVGVIGVWLVYSAGRAVSNAADLRRLAPMTWNAAKS